ncbi:MAG: alpha/beta hydrolase [Bacteroidetes bacterium]|nr:alpha/beta hydrolase [Bacteroidota bacterium]
MKNCGFRSHKLLISLSLLLLQYAVFAQYSSFDTTHYGRNPEIGKYADIRGIRMYYEIYGEGEPLLMIHGNGGSISSFMYQIPFFSKNYQVIAVDSRAQGKSIDLNDSLSFEMMADDFSTLLDELHIDSCNVLGWSDGGINGLLLAIRHPEKVRKLAITGANLWPDSSAISGQDFLWGKNYYDTLSKMEPNPEILHNKKLVGLDLFEPHITKDQLRQIKCPTLVIGGDHDIILVSHTVFIAQSIPGAYLWILPNSSHATLIDHKDRFNEVVDDFFDDRLDE